MRTNKMLVLALIAVSVIATFAATGGYVIGKDDDSATCPDGQTLQAFDTKAGKDTLHAEQPKNLPPGYSVEDTVSGSGTDYTVRSDEDSATIKSNGPVQLEVACR